MRLTRYNPCTEEQVEGVLEIHWVWIVNQGRVDSIHTNVRGTAVGTTTGNQYLFRHNYKDDYAKQQESPPGTRADECGVILSYRVMARQLLAG